MNAPEMDVAADQQEWHDIMPTLANPMWSPLGFDPSNTTTVVVFEEATNPLPDAIPITGNNMNFQELPPVSPNEMGLMLNLIPPAAPGPPDRREFRGELNFQVSVNCANERKKYLYSSKLKRIYVSGDCDFPLEFKWDDGPGTPRPAYVRATVVFLDKDQAESRVKTCIHHKSILEKKQLKDPQYHNVLHSSRDARSDGVYYGGGPDTWYSTVVKYDNNPRSHVYKFVCRHSCSGGINRRPICIIFTIEDIRGYVYGREIVNVRVCACPARDLKKDEKAEFQVQDSEGRETSRRPAPDSDSRKAKKVKLEVVTEPTAVIGDDRVIELPKIKVRGSQTAVAGFEVMVRMMEQHQRMSTDNSEITEDAIMIASLRQLIENIKAEAQQH